MPSFARIDGTNTGTDIFTLDNGDCLDASGNHSSTIGAAMCEQKKACTWVESAEKNKEGLLKNYNNHLFLKKTDSNFIGFENKKFTGKIISVNKRGELRIKKTNNQVINYSENSIKFLP